MDRIKLLELAIVDCARLAALTRRALDNQHASSIENSLVTDMLLLFGLIEWSVPLEFSEQSELRRASVYIEHGKPIDALECADAVIQSLWTRYYMNDLHPEDPLVLPLEANSNLGIRNSLPKISTHTSTRQAALPSGLSTDGKNGARRISIVGPAKLNLPEWTRRRSLVQT
ncbi:hypothetical protein [Candidatus Burkholderia verschuerenii]|uniref:hypothetical protein n=1 Tax=Candidatus Burkholderia verschuerenii TaxID=242163 RepID=UPI00067A9F9E|nr:hypothetical protein [Candidatus Burkholderia verschuerenii]